MLFDPGPIALIVDAQFPVRVDAPSFLGIATSALAERPAIDGALATAGGQIATETGQAADAEIGAELGAAADAAAADGDDVDSSIADVQSNAGALTGDLSALVDDNAEGLDAEFDDNPFIPPDAVTTEIVPVTELAWDEQTLATFLFQLGRPPTPDELHYARRFRPDTRALLEWVWAVGGVSVPPSTPPPSGGGGPQTPPPGGGNQPAPSPPGTPPLDAFAQGVIALYRQYLQRTPSAEEIDIHRGNPHGLAGVLHAIMVSEEYAALHGGSSAPADNQDGYN
jgi:hypothetical protein